MGLLGLVVHCSAWTEPSFCTAACPMLAILMAFSRIPSNNSKSGHCHSCLVTFVLLQRCVRRNSSSGVPCCRTSGQVSLSLPLRHPFFTRPSSNFGVSASLQLHGILPSVSCQLCVTFQRVFTVPQRVDESCHSLTCQGFFNSFFQNYAGHDVLVLSSFTAMHVTEYRLRVCNGIWPKKLIGHHDCWSPDTSSHLSSTRGDECDLCHHAVCAPITERHTCCFVFFPLLLQPVCFMGPPRTLQCAVPAFPSPSTPSASLSVIASSSSAKPFNSCSTSLSSLSLLHFVLGLTNLFVTLEPLTVPYQLKTRPASSRHPCPWCTPSCSRPA